jgi:hypothetical protein
MNAHLFTATRRRSGCRRHLIRRRMIGRQPHISCRPRALTGDGGPAPQSSRRPPSRCRSALRLTTWPRTAKTMITTTNQLPMIAATTPMTIAIAIAMPATRTLVCDVMEHRLENSHVSGLMTTADHQRVTIGRCRPGSIHQRSSRSCRAFHGRTCRGRVASAPLASAGCARRPAAGDPRLRAGAEAL